jgi:hypothetical protein
LDPELRVALEKRHDEKVGSNPIRHFADPPALAKSWLTIPRVLGKASRSLSTAADSGQRPWEGDFYLEDGSVILCALTRCGGAHRNDAGRGLPRSRLAVLVKHFSQIEGGRQSWRVAFPLAEMLLLLTCATIIAPAVRLGGPVAQPKLTESMKHRAGSPRRAAFLFRTMSAALSLPSALYSKCTVFIPARSNPSLKPPIPLNSRAPGGRE